MATPPTYAATRLDVPCEATGSVSAWIVPLDPGHVRAFETVWRPRLIEMKQFDATLDWGKWLLDSADDPALEIYALVTAASSYSAAIARLASRPPRRQRLEGMCCIRGGFASHLVDGSSVTYLELLFSAPWNRHEHKPTRELRCGPTMMAHVIRRSIAAGFEGRVGLHSLEDPHTHAAYRRWGMTECGRDPDVDNELYFEFTTDHAARFLTRTP